MAQKIFTNYKDKVESFPLGEENVGILKPGRYSGFDLTSYTGTLRILISHGVKVRKTGVDNLYKSPFGAILLPTGSILHEDASVELDIDNNIGNGNVRIDYVICEHIYEAVEGGTVAQYSILKGPLNGNEPTLVNPQTQVKVGVITIEAGGHNNTHVIYKPEMVNALGDMSYTDLADWVNTIVIFPTQYLVPQNGIIMFNGIPETIPVGWALCDGTNGTPDLRDRFVVSTGLTHTLGATGGSNIATIAKANLPAENYSATTSSTGGHTHTGTAAANGGHNHTASTVAAGSHNHFGGVVGPAGGTNYKIEGYDGAAPNNDNYQPNTTTATDGSHTHAVNVLSVGDHTHTLSLSTEGPHAHTVTVGPLGSGTPLDTKPTFYALAFIMKL